MHNPSSNTADLDLRALLLVLTNQANNPPKKGTRELKNLTPSVGATLISLEHSSSNVRYTFVPAKKSLDKIQKNFLCNILPLGNSIGLFQIFYQ